MLISNKAIGLLCLRTTLSITSELDNWVECLPEINQSEFKHRVDVFSKLLQDLFKNEKIHQAQNFKELKYYLDQVGRAIHNLPEWFVLYGDSKALMYAVNHLDVNLSDQPGCSVYAELDGTTQKSLKSKDLTPLERFRFQSSFLYKIQKLLHRFDKDNDFIQSCWIKLKRV